MKCTPVLLSIPLLVVTLWPTVSGALSVSTAEEVLKSEGYETDSASLVEYLDSGIPVDFVKKAEPRLGEMTHMQYRWEQYPLIIAHLGVLKANDAIPILTNILEGRFPPPIEADIVDIESSGGSPRWEGFELERTELRLACAWSLAEIGYTDARDILDDLLNDLAVNTRNNVNGDGSSWARLYIRGCHYLARFGDRRGIDQLISAFDWTAAGEISFALREVTGYSFGPDATYPPHRYPIEIQRWKDWWAANRESWEAPFEWQFMYRTVVPDPHLPRDYLIIANETKMAGNSYDGVAWEPNGRRYERAVKWLEEHGRRHAREFRRIAMDEDERYPIRGEALEWYARFGGRGAEKLVREYATTTKWQDEGEKGAVIWIQERAKKLQRRYFP